VGIETDAAGHEAGCDPLTFERNVPGDMWLGTLEFQARRTVRFLREWTLSRQANCDDLKTKLQGS